MDTSLETAVHRTLTFVRLAGRRRSVSPDCRNAPGGEESPRSLASDMIGGALTSTESQQPVSNEEYNDDVSKLTNLQVSGMEANSSTVRLVSAGANAASGSGRDVDLEGDVRSQPGRVISLPPRLFCSRLRHCSFIVVR